MGQKLSIQWSQSLRVCLTLGVTVALGITLVAFIVLHYREHRARVLREAEANLVNIGQMIEGSLEHALVTQDFAETQQIMDNVGRQRDIRSIVLLNNQSQVRFAPGGKGGGTRLNLDDPGCQVCHRAGEPPQGGSIIFTTAQGEPVLRNCNPIENRPQCHACHDPQNRLNGALLTDFSLAETNTHLADDLRMSVGLGLTAVIAVILMVNLFLDRLVLSKLDRMMLAINRFGAGDRSQRVPTRGADEIGRLATAFNRMADGLQTKEQETERLYHELQQKAAAHAQLLQQVIRVQEEERKRIARELHDDFAQTLTALTINLEAALQTLPAAMASLKDQLLHVQDLTMTTLGQTHWWIQDLRPRVLDDLGLVPAIRWYTETRLETLGVQVQLEVSSFKGRLPAELETTLFRVIQEAINNVAKHAQARQACIRLEFVDARVIAEVMDDGVGFDPQEFLTMHEGMRGIGLLGMRERVALLGGLLTVDSQPGRGTRIRIEVPWTI